MSRRYTYQYSTCGKIGNNKVTEHTYTNDDNPKIMEERIKQIVSKSKSKINVIYISRDAFNNAKYLENLADRYTNASFDIFLWEKSNTVQIGSFNPKVIEETDGLNAYRRYVHPHTVMGDDVYIYLNGLFLKKINYPNERAISMAIDDILNYRGVDIHLFEWKKWFFDWWMYITKIYRDFSFKNVMTKENIIFVLKAMVIGYLIFTLKNINENMNELLVKNV